MGQLDSQPISDQLGRCVKCGKCLARCPLYRELRDEKLVARGKATLSLALINHELPLSDTLAQAAEKCLFCLNCQAACPQELPMGQIIPFLRRETAYHSRLKSLSYYLVNKKLGPAGLVKNIPKAARFFLQSLAQRVPPDRGIHLRFGLPNFPRQRLLPVLAKKPLIRKKLPAQRSGTTKKGVVGYFVGCLHNFLAGTTGLSIIEILTKLGYTVVLPKDQTCCGLPFYALGMDEAFEKLVVHNNTAFSSECDLIVSGCPTCISTLQKYYPQYGASATALAEKTVDLSTLLWDERSNLAPLIQPTHLGSQVTYHDPCHLAVGLKVRQQPRELLKLLYGDSFSEMPEADRCCGGGGSFSVTNYDLSQAIGVRKRKGIETWLSAVVQNTEIQRNLTSGVSSKQELNYKVVTACPGCELQLRDTLYMTNPDVKVANVFDEIFNHF